MGTLAIPTMTNAEYFAAPGLSNSGMKDLAISPLRFWHRWINPNAPLETPSPEMQFGSAVHCLVLEPSEFDSRYACELIPPDDCLDTIEDLRRALEAVGIKPKGGAKGPIIARVQDALPDAPILSVLKQRHAEQNASKVLFKADDWKRIHGAAESLLSEPRVRDILNGEGRAEVPYFVTDPETGVRLKAKMDFVAPGLILDVKTFSQKRGRSIDESITRAIWDEGYHRQGYDYSFIRALAEGREHPQANGEFVLTFVESQEPFETRIRVLRPKCAGEVSLLWERARIQVRELIRLYADCLAHFGADKPWRYASEIDPLMDQEFPGVIF
jgi:hypothetical protein